MFPDEDTPMKQDETPPQGTAGEDRLAGAKPPGEDRWLSVDEIAAHLGIKRETVYPWITQKNMPAHKVGRLWKFKRDEVDKWVRTGHAAP